MPIENLLLMPVISASNEIQTLSPTGSVAQLIQERIRANFDRRSNLHHGSFVDDAHPVADLIKQLPGVSDRSETLTALANNLISHWQPLLNDTEAPTSAIILLLYRDAVSLHLVLATAGSQPSVQLNAQGQPELKSQLNLEQLQRAVKVNLTALQMEQDGHLCFFGTKGKTDDPESFFTLTGCAESIDAKEATSDLLRAADDFCQQHQLSSPKTEVMEQIVDYMQQQKKDREPVELDQVSRMLDVYIPPEQAETHAGTFGSFAKQGPYRLSEQFQPHNLTLNRIGRLQARTGSWKLELAQQALGLLNSQRDVLYDPDNGRLILNNLPPALQQQLSAATNKRSE
ncbi:nucleoid-associated protein [Pontibacter sp. JAM-7]|uniref:nucleoid-associated protein n=1 Tax=Pontibacter sp. JAM-7 TaxID=3366581 RepID=UPI003AF4565F